MILNYFFSFLSSMIYGFIMPASHGLGDTRRKKGPKFSGECNSLLLLMSRQGFKLYIMFLNGIIKFPFCSANVFF